MNVAVSWDKSENGYWTVTATKQIGPYTFEEKRVCNQQPTEEHPLPVSLLAALEQRAVRELEMTIAFWRTGVIPQAKIDAAAASDNLENLDIGHGH